MALDFGKLNFSVSFNPTSAFPLDARSYFESYADALAAAQTAAAAGSTDSTYYFGQTVVVVENKFATFYIIQPDGSLQQIAAGDDVKITIDSSLFEYNENGELTLKGFDNAQAGQYFSLDEDGNVIWVTPDVYTKTETDEQISKAVAAADHLKRKIVADLDEAKTYMANNDDADQYIFMVPTGLEEADDKYDEYVVIVVADTPMLEKVGSWEVDLSGYAKTTDLDSKVDKEDGARLITDEEAEKLANLQDSLIKSVDEQYFDVNASGHLRLMQLDQSDVYGLEDALNSKVDKQEGWTLLSPSDQEKLSKLTLGEDDNLEVSGSVSAENVVGLGTWIVNNVTGLTENNLSSDLTEKINFITSVDTTTFSVVSGELKLTPTDGSRLITPKEIATLQAIDDGEFNNYIDSVNGEVFSVTSGNLDLVAVPMSALVPTLGNLTLLPNYDNGMTLVDEINNIYDILTWQEMPTN